MKKRCLEFLTIVLVLLAAAASCENQFVIDILPKYGSGNGNLGGKPGSENIENAGTENPNTENPGDGKGGQPLFSVHFNSRGGTAVPSIVNIESGSTIEKPADPTREYFTFSLWYRDAGLSSEWNFASETVESDITLYAGWSFSGAMGSGTEYDPYVVYNEETLLAVGRGTGKFAGWLRDKHYRQIENIELASPGAGGAGNWTPITTGGQFTGVYDGNGHTISNLKSIDSTKDRQSMFGTIGSEGVVENLWLINAVIIGKSHTGGIAGDNYGTVQGCFISGIIDGSGGNNAGGVAGNNHSVIQNCHTAGSVIGNHAGGIAGSNYTNAIVQNCYASGDIGGKGSGRAGGIVGNNYTNAIVRNCAALNASIIAEGSSIGRIAGADGTLKNNYARDDMITIRNSSMNYNPSSGLDKRDGADIGPSQFNNEFWWKDGTTWNTASPAFAWDFTDAWEWGSGLPVLRGKS